MTELNQELFDNFFDLKEKQNIKQLIIDGNNLAARNNFMNPDLRSPDGRKTGAVFGSIRSIKMLIEMFAPEETIVVFDMGWSKRRLEMYPEYKANRKDVHKTPEEIKSKEEYITQIKRLQVYIEHLPIKQVRVKSTEADDIIAYLLNKSSNKNETVLVSNDSDFYQFVQFGVKIYNPILSQFIDDKYIKEKLKIQSSEYLMYKAMLGDGSDNISAIKGFGEGAAVKILQTGLCKSISDAKQIAATMKGVKFENLVNSFNLVERNYKLIDLLTDYLDNDTKEQIESQLITNKTLNHDIFNLCKEDGIKWDLDYIQKIK